MRETKATLAYFAGQLIELAADNDRFEAAFVDTDLGGSRIDIDRGLEVLYTDDPRFNATENATEAAWSAAFDKLCETVGEDELLGVSVDRFNGEDEDKQWTKRATTPVQRRLVIIARKILAGLYPMPTLKPAA